MNIGTENSTRSGPRSQPNRAMNSAPATSPRARALDAPRAGPAAAHRTRGKRGPLRVDRRSRIWGNRFRRGRDGTPVEVIANFTRDLWRRIRTGEITIEQLVSIRGRDLVCWCYPPNPCHAHVILAAIEWAWHVWTSRPPQRVTEEAPARARKTDVGGPLSLRSRARQWRGR